MLIRAAGSAQKDASRAEEELAGAPLRFESAANRWAVCIKLACQPLMAGEEGEGKKRWTSPPAWRNFCCGKVPNWNWGGASDANRLGVFYLDSSWSQRLSWIESLFWKTRYNFQILSLVWIPAMHQQQLLTKTGLVDPNAWLVTLNIEPRQIDSGSNWSRNNGEYNFLSKSNTIFFSIIQSIFIYKELPIHNMPYFIYSILTSIIQMCHWISCNYIININFVFKF